MQNTKKLERAVARRGVDCSSPVLTDQSYKKSSDINNIVKAYQKTGILPKKKMEGHYGDFSQVPTLEASFEAANLALEAFMSLPADVRKLMDNDASKLELWLSDAKNQKMAQEYGLLEKISQAADVVSHDNNNNNSGEIDASVSN